MEHITDDLSGKLIIITGASSGIGREIAISLSRLNAKLILIARSESGLRETLALMKSNNHRYYAYDLKQVSKISEMVSDIVEENGKIDGLVHCAGVSADRPLNMTSYDFLHDIFLVHYYSFVELVRNLSKKNNHNDNMSIVVMSSIASIRGEKAKLAYTSAKAAVDGAVKVMAVELAGKHIRVNSIRPGFIKTNMYYKHIINTGEENMEKMLLRYPNGAGETVDVANAAIFLLSNASKFINGAHIPVDGGASVD